MNQLLKTMHGCKRENGTKSKTTSIYMEKKFIRVYLITVF